MANHCPGCGRFLANCGTWDMRVLWATVRLTAWVCWKCRAVELAAKHLPSPTAERDNDG